MFLSRVQNLLRDAPLRTTLIFAVLLIVGQAIFASFDLRKNFSQQGNDDIMRLVMVRDLIAGQGWFDIVQYRVLPPEGMPLHWSRYIDAGIAAVIVPLSYIFAMPTAELLAASIWPTLIQLIALAVVAISARRLLGVHAACFAILCFVLWPVTSNWHAAAGNLDHHNVQMLMMTLMAVSAVWPDRHITAGIVGGIAAGFSLAIGLETLPFVVAVGALVLARALLTNDRGTRLALVSFCMSLAVGTVLFWLGQTPPALRTVPMCDRLSPSILSVVWIAAAASTLPVFLGRWLKGPLLHLGATMILTVLGMSVAWPLLVTCFTGPYGDLPQNMQDFIKTGVGEALPGLTYVAQYTADSIVFILPLVMTPVLTGYFLIREWREDTLTETERTTLLGLGFLCLFGLGMTFYQMRTATMAGSVIPILVGFILARLFSEYFRTREANAALIALVVATALVSPGTVASAAKPLLPKAPDPLADVGDCRSHGSVAALNEVAPGLILNHFNFGPHLLWLTHHDILSAGYHTSAAALTNSITPFGLEEEPLKAYIADTGATHFLICANARYGTDFLTSLAAGAEVDWLRPVPLSDEDQVLLEVLGE